MKSKVFFTCIVVLLLVPTLTLIGCSSSSNPSTETPSANYSEDVQSGVDVCIDWVDFIHFNNISYLHDIASDYAVSPQDLGSQYGVVTFNVAENVTSLGYSIKNGDAGFLKEGTVIYTLPEYSPSFRLAASVDGQVFLYEADSNPDAKYGKDFLDIAGKVAYIGINSSQDGKTELAKIKSPEYVAELVDMVLEAPVTQQAHDHTSSCFIEFHLNDGTSVSHSFDVDTSILWRNIQLPKEFSDIIAKTMEYGDAYTYQNISPTYQNAPVTINELSDGQELHANLVKFAGSVTSHETTVLVNNIKATVNQDGNYYVYLDLVEGKNSIEVKTIKGTNTNSESIAVTFKPPLTVFPEYPEPETGVDYTKTPIVVNGIVSDPKAVVSVNGVTAEVLSDGKFCAQVQLKEGSNGIETIATLGEEVDSVMYLAIILSNGGWTYAPGSAGGSRYLSKVSHDDLVALKAGETTRINFVLDARKGIQNSKDVSYKVVRVASEYPQILRPDGSGLYEVPLSAGMKVSVEPSEFAAYPNTVYTSSLIIETTPALEPGQYFLHIGCFYGDFQWTSGVIKVVVE